METAVAPGMRTAQASTYSPAHGGEPEPPFGVGRAVLSPPGFAVRPGEEPGRAFMHAEPHAAQVGGEPGAECLDVWPL
jgi:hypothetical protein